MEEINTGDFSALFQQIIFFSVISSLVIYGLKSSIKTAMNKKPEETLNRFIGLTMMYVFGFIACIFLKGELVENIFARLFFGLIIGSVGVGLYASVIKSVLGLIPNITKKIFGA